MSNQTNFEPYIKPEQKIGEFSVRAMVLGVILAIVFGAANAYVGLKVGMTVSASIPAAVISMTILRGVLRRGTVLENNIVQSLGSSGESLAAGVIFTIPALIFLGFAPSILEMFILSALGGCLGILLMIPLRRYLIVREHGQLPYPEGTACARILIAGEEGGSKSRLVFTGAIIGAVYKFLMSGLGLWKNVVSAPLKLKPCHTIISVEVTPILLGVGYIIGHRISALMFSGAVLGWLVLIPLIQYVGAGLTQPLSPATNLIAELSAVEVWKYYIRYIGAGAVLLGGMVALFKALPIIIQTIRQGVSGSALLTTSRPSGRLGNSISGGITLRTERDIPMKYVGLIALLIALATFLYLVIYKGEMGLSTTWGMGMVGILLVLVFGALFITVAARIVGIVGSSSSPVSGMTITTLIATALVFVLLGWTDNTGKVLAMSIGAIVCIAVCMSGDISQDLKTGYLVGGTPYKIQIAEFIGVLAPTVAIALVLLLLDKTYKLGSDQLPAPQASLMKMIIDGVFSASLPWLLVLVGIFIGLGVELLGISSLPFAIGLYLPFSLSAPIMLGGLVYYLTQRKSPAEPGILFSSGLVAGDALMGIVMAVLASFSWDKIINQRGSIPENPVEDIIGLAAFILLSLILMRFIRRSISAEASSTQN